MPSTSFAVTLFWKISIHMAVVVSAVVILVLVFGRAFSVLAPLITLVARARVELGDRKAAQVGAGALLGATVATFVFMLLRSTSPNPNGD